jgi:hypothetical protein
MSDIVLVGKLGIGIACAVLTVVLFAVRPRFDRLAPRRFDAVVVLFLVASRLALFTVLYAPFLLAMNGERSDIGVYMVEGRQILDGAVLYREVKSSYAPLFPYAVAGILALWNSYLAFILVTIGIELVAMPFWLAAARERLGDRVTRTAALLYVASPIPLVNVAMNGQNQVWQAGLLAIAVWLLARRDVASGLVYGLTLGAVKLLGLLFAPVLWLFARRRILWLVAFVAVPVLVYAWCFVGLGLTWEDVRYPLDRQGGHVTPGNLPYLLTITGMDLAEDGLATQVANGVLLLGLAAVFLTAWVRGAARNPANVFHLITLVMLTLFLLSKKSYPSYLVLAFFPLCASLAARPPGWKLLLWFCFFGLVAVVEPSVYFRWVKRYGDLSLLWQDAVPEGTARWRVMAFLACDLVLLGSYAVYFVRTWRVMAPEPVSPSTE